MGTKKPVARYLAIVLCIAVFALLCALRAPKADEVYWNGDAPYHVLLTAQCYRETPVSTHKFVPLVTLGAPYDKWVDWGSTLPDANGNFYYTSFSAAAFVAPYLFFRVLRLPVTLLGLYWFNCLLYGLCAALTAAIFVRLLRGRLPTAFVIAAATLLYLTPPEIQHAQGVAYWAQSLFQAGFLLQLWLFLCLPQKKRWVWVSFFALCVVMPYVEWTGYLSNVGFVLAFLLRQWQQAPQGARLRALVSRQSVGFALSGAACTLGALAVFCAHYLLVNDAGAFFDAMYTRFFTRSVLSGATSFGALLAQYVRGFGPLLLLTAAVLAVTLCVPAARRALGRLLAECAVPLVALAFPVLENYVLRGHATLYTYDTIKIVWVPIFLLLLCAAALWEAFPGAQKRVLGALGGAVALACAVMVLQYNFLPNDYRWRVDYLDDSAAVAAYINETYPGDTALLANEDRAQRGWENLLFHRNIFEWRSLEQLINRAALDSKRFVVVLQTQEEPGAANFYRMPGFWVYDGRLLETQYYAWENGAPVPRDNALPQLPEA